MYPSMRSDSRPSACIPWSPREPAYGCSAMPSRCSQCAGRH